MSPPYRRGLCGVASPHPRSGLAFGPRPVQAASGSSGRRGTAEQCVQLRPLVALSGVGGWCRCSGPRQGQVDRVVIDEHTAPRLAVAVPQECPGPFVRAWRRSFGGQLKRELGTGPMARPSSGSPTTLAAASRRSSKPSASAARPVTRAISPSGALSAQARSLRSAPGTSPASKLRPCLGQLGGAEEGSGGPGGG